jgi:hypothetical protein
MSREFKKLPRHVVDLARTALHEFDRSLGGDYRRLDHERIEEMLEHCTALLGEDIDHVWMVALYASLHDQADDLRRRWPTPQVRFQGELVTKSPFSQLYASVALWKIFQAAADHRLGEARSALDNLALAAQALHAAASFGMADEEALRASDVRRSGAVAKLINDPRTPARGAIRREWLRWQNRETSYTSDADFGRKMHVRHPEFVSDRSIAQLAARWRKESSGNR